MWNVGRRQPFKKCRQQLEELDHALQPTNLFIVAWMFGHVVKDIAAGIDDALHGDDKPAPQILSEKVAFPRWLSWWSDELKRHRGPL